MRFQGNFKGDIRVFKEVLLLILLLHVSHWNYPKKRKACFPLNYTIWPVYTVNAEENEYLKRSFGGIYCIAPILFRGHLGI